MKNTQVMTAQRFTAFLKAQRTNDAQLSAALLHCFEQISKRNTAKLRLLLDLPTFKTLAGKHNAEHGLILSYINSQIEAKLLNITWETDRYQVGLVANDVPFDASLFTTYAQFKRQARANLERETKEKEAAKALAQADLRQASRIKKDNQDLVKHVNAQISSVEKGLAQAEKENLAAAKALAAAKTQEDAVKATNALQAAKSKAESLDLAKAMLEAEQQEAAKALQAAKDKEEAESLKLLEGVTVNFSTLSKQLDKALVGNIKADLVQLLELAEKAQALASKLANQAAKTDLTVDTGRVDELNNNAAKSPNLSRVG